MVAVVEVVALGGPKGVREAALGERTMVIQGSYCRALGEGRWD